MIKEINLVPWRLQAFEQRKHQLTTAMVVAITSAMIMVMLVHYLIQLIVCHYENTNKVVQQQLATSNQQVKEIHHIQQQQQKYAEQLKQLKSWQSQRDWLPQLMNDMTKNLPNGIYLTQLKREDNTVLLSGRAESNAEVTHLLQSIHRSSVLQNPALKQIQTQAVTGFYDQNFIVKAFVRYKNEH